MSRQRAAGIFLLLGVAILCLQFAGGGGILASSPFGVPEFATLIVEESAKRGELPKEQYAILMSTKAGSVRDYCESKGKLRLFDLSPDGDLSKVEPFWKAGVETAKGLTPPYMVAGAVGHRYVGPLPKDTAAALAILKPMGGN